MTWLRPNRAAVRRTSRRWLPLSWALLASLVVGLPAWAQVKAFAGDDPGRVVSIGVLPSAEGWVLTERRLLWSKDDGLTWRSDVFVAPPDSSLSAAFFSDRFTGWILLGGRSTMSVVRTTNGGDTWARTDIAVPAGVTAAGGSLSFIDDLRGWVMVRLSSRATVPGGMLFRTDDGGRTWEPLPPRPPAGLSASSRNPTGG